MISFEKHILSDFQREEELAFVVANLHIHHLVERSTLGSAAVYVFVCHVFDFYKVSTSN